MTVEEYHSLPAPREVKAFGEPERVYVPGGGAAAWGQFMTHGTGPWATFFGFFLIGVAFLVVLAGLIGMKKGMPPTAFLVVLVAALFFLGLGLFTYIRNEAAQKKPENQSNAGGNFAYAVFPAGLAIVRDGQWTAIRWEQIYEFHGVYLGHSLARVKLADGREFQLQGVGSLDELSKTVEERSFFFLYQRAQSTLDGGGSLQFGAVTVSPGGLSFKNKQIGWQEIDKIQLGALSQGGGIAGGIQEANAQLIIREQKLLGIGLPWCAEPFMPMPNRLVLLKLLRTMAQSATAFEATPALGIYMPAMF